MIALDTNVLVRYFAQDDVAQSAKASQLIESLHETQQGFITQIVLIETIWVMKRLFEADRETVSAIVKNMLQVPSFIIENREAVSHAVDLFSTTNADFADCLIAKVAELNGCTDVMTFDQGAAKSCGMRLIDSEIK